MKGITIVPAPGLNPFGTKVYASDGSEVEGVMSIRIDMAPNACNTATVEIMVTNVAPIDAAAELGPQTLADLDKLGFQAMRKGAVVAWDDMATGRTEWIDASGD